MMKTENIVYIDTDQHELDNAFKEAVIRVNTHTEPFPADFLLRIYAYYKKANKEESSISQNAKTIVDAFKANAMLQITQVTPEEAKRKYIELVTNYFL